MSYQSLIAHNGVTHQKYKPVEKPQPSTTETKSSKPKIDAQIVTPGSYNSSEKQTVEPLTTTETTVAPNSANATLVTGFGESIFSLLIVSPFLLLGFKKWLHR